MSRRRHYRDGLDAAAAPGAGPAGSVEQKAADLPLQAGRHLTPLAAPHDSSWGKNRPETELRHKDFQNKTSPFSRSTRKTRLLRGRSDMICFNHVITEQINGKLPCRTQHIFLKRFYELKKKVKNKFSHIFKNGSNRLVDKCEKWNDSSTMVNNYRYIAQPGLDTSPEQGSYY